MILEGGYLEDNCELHSPHLSLATRDTRALSTDVLDRTSVSLIMNEHSKRLPEVFQGARGQVIILKLY